MRDDSDLDGFNYHIDLLKALKTLANYKWHMSNLVAFIRLNLFVKIDLQYWLDKPFEEPQKVPTDRYIQGLLFFEKQKNTQILN